jgi:capsule polysaccharide export protein KpsE/RkpR
MRWRWFIAGVVFFTSVIMLVVVFLLPKTYKSTVTILPPYEGGGALPFLEGLSLDIFGANEVSTAALVPLLTSRNIMDRVHERFNLIEHYEKDDIEQAYKAFEDHLEIEVETEETFGLLTIVAVGLSVLDREPEVCAELVNITAEEWNSLFLDINRQGAKLRRRFLEENLFETSDNLAMAEDSMRKFQEKYGITSIEAQVEGTVAAAVALEQQILNTSVMVKVMERIFQPGHPELQRAKLELQELQRQQLEMRTSADKQSLLLPIGLAPEIGQEYARLMRHLTTLEALHAILIQQYEQAKMQEMRETPSLRIVDQGQVPIRKYKPRRGILLIMAALSALFISILIVYFLDYLERVKGTDEGRWIVEVTGYLRSDLERILPRKKAKS